MNKKIKNTIKISSALVGITTTFIISYTFSSNVIIPNEENKATTTKNSNYNIYYSENDTLIMETVTYNYIYSIVNYYVNTTYEYPNIKRLNEKIYYHIKNSELYNYDNTIKENIDLWAKKDFSNLENFFNYLNAKVGAENMYFLSTDNARIDIAK